MFLSDYPYFSRVDRSVGCENRVRHSIGIFFRCITEDSQGPRSQHRRLAERCLVTLGRGWSDDNSIEVDVRERMECDCLYRTR